MGGWPAYVYGRGMLYQWMVASLCLWERNAVPGGGWPAYVYGRRMLYQGVGGQPMFMVGECCTIGWMASLFMVEGCCTRGWVASLRLL